MIFHILTVLLLSASPVPTDPNTWLADALRQEAATVANGTAAKAADAALVTMATRRDAESAQKLVQQALNATGSDLRDATLATATWWREYADPNFKQANEPRLSAMLAAVKQSTVPLEATSDFLRRASQLVVLGQALHDGNTTHLGADQLATWMQITGENGIAEYDAPDASAAAVVSLLHAYRAAEPGPVHDSIKRALDYFCHDLAANFFAPRGMLAGAHSHDVSVLHSHGMVDGLAREFGWHDAIPAHPNLGLAVLLLNRDAKGYHPDESLRQLARQENKTVRQRWGHEPGQDRITTMTADYAIGISNRDGADDDKSLAVVMKSPRDLTDITVVADGTDAPYGAHHLRIAPVQVQHESTVLSTFHVHPDGKAPSSLATNVLLPLDASEIALGGRPMRHDRAFQLPLAPQSIITVRDGNSAVAVRILLAESCGKQPADAVFKIDTEGQKARVGRIALYHTTKRPPDTCLPRVALLVVARQITSDAALTQLRNDVAKATFTQKTDRGVWHVEAKVAGVGLMLERNADDSIVQRRINGDEVHFNAPLEIQGAAVGL